MIGNQESRVHDS